MVRFSIFCTWFAAAILSFDAVAAADHALEVANHADGDVLCCRVALLSGTLDSDSERIVAENLSSCESNRVTAGEAFRGRFKILVPLEPGQNRIALASESQQTRITLFYRPTTEPLLRVIYFQARDEKTPSADEQAALCGRLATAAFLLQTAIAEKSDLFGEPGQTFAVESNDKTQVKVHFVRGAKFSADYCRMTQSTLFDEIYREIAVQLPFEGARQLALLSFSRYNDALKRHEGIAASGGGNLALVGVASFDYWPETLADVYPTLTDSTGLENARFESAGRDTVAGAVSATLGFALHELGHAFGLADKPGDLAPKLDVMNQGFVHFGRIFLVREPAQSGSESSAQAVEIPPEREPFLRRVCE